MSAFTAPKGDKTVFISPREGALLEYLEASGRLPPVTLSIFPLESLNNPKERNTEVFIDKFINYQFSNSILIPVDSFTCEFYWGSFLNFREGDICVVRGNNIPIFSGIIDQLDIETDTTQGTKVTVTGRDLLGQWEDQDAVNAFTKPIFGTQYTIGQVVRALAKDTRIDPTKLILQVAPTMPYLFATQPGETKLSAMQRFCEALDIYFWMNGDGRLIVGRPNVRGSAVGRYFIRQLSSLQNERVSNCLSIRSSSNATQIPNIIVPIWNGQETVQDIAKEQQAIYNGSPGPTRLRKLGHLVPKAVVVSTPEGASPQDLAEVNALTIAGQPQNQKLTKAGSSTILQLYAKREIARANVKDLNVQVQIVGHYNDSASPVTVDQVYRVQNDVARIDEDMYLYQVDYRMDEQGSQMSNLFFCRQTAIVSDVRAL